MMVGKSDLQFFYTNVEPYVAQPNPARSIGGYPSTTTYGTSTLSTNSIVNSTTDILLSSALSGGKTLIDSEIIQTQGVGTDLTVLVRGAMSTPIQPHVTGLPVYSIPSQSLFNNALSSDLCQYRCLAVKNVNPTDSFNNLSFYFKSQSLTPLTTVQMAVEVPKTEYYSGTVSSGSVISIVDPGLSGYANNYFVGCVVKILTNINSIAGYQRAIISFDSATSTIVLDSSLTAVATGDTYEIQNAPAQTVSNGTVSPSFGTSNVSSLASPNNVASAIGIDVTGNRVNTGNLAPNEVVYLWLTRQRANNSPAQINNRIVFTAHYTG